MPRWTYWPSWHGGEGTPGNTRIKVMRRLLPHTAMERKMALSTAERTLQLTMPSI
jgi:hypothetical protein